jgi:hypothetical protein
MNSYHNTMSNFESYVPLVDNPDGTDTPVDPIQDGPAPLQGGVKKGLGGLYATVCKGALCPQTDPEAFYPEKGASTADAKKICARCEVTSKCLQLAIKNDEEFGVWGGKSVRERRKISEQWEAAQKQGMTWQEFYETLPSDAKLPSSKLSSAPVRRSISPTIRNTIQELSGYDEQLPPEQMALATSALYALYRSAVENRAIDNARLAKNILSEREFQDYMEQYFCSEVPDLTSADAVRRLLVGSSRQPSYLSRLRTALGEDSDEILRQAIRDSIEPPTQQPSSELVIPRSVD